jgi:hypothetical protein
MWQPPQGCFEVAPLIAPEHQYRSDERLKRFFAQKLNEGLKPFDGAYEVLGDATEALWASNNWPNDPIVIEAVKNKEDDGGKNLKLLDKEQLAHKVLLFYEQTDATGKFYIYEGKDRLAALKLYADICGYISKVEVDNSTKNYETKTMNIRLVSPEKKEEVIEAKPLKQITNENVLPLKVKLVR